VDKFRKMNLDIAQHRKKIVERDLEKEFKDEENPFRLAIVCAMWITGFDAPCISTVYLDKPIKGHTLMQTIARANRVYDDEKENGLIVDCGNVNKPLEKAYSIYGEGGSRGGNGEKTPNGSERPFELLEGLAEELKETIKQTKGYLTELGYDLNDLSKADAKPMEKIANIKKAVDCICLNETTRTKFEIMARDVFRKYHALYPEVQVKPFVRQFNAIEAIYQQLNQQTKSADVISIIMELQQVVNDSIVIDNTSVNEPKEEVYVDLSTLDFDKLKAAFAKTQKKNTVVYDLQRAVDMKLEQMLKENPLRLEFYERYQEIIKEYNQGKSLEDTVTAFNNLNEFIKDLSFEEARAFREELDQESLAIFDLLKTGKELSTKELKAVKKVAVDLLLKLKAEKLRVERWRESRQLTAQVKTIIFDTLQWLPQESYSDQEVGEKTINIYQHIYSNYPGGGNSVYQVRF